jgi:hypothetical protein
METNEVNMMEYEAPAGLKPFTRRIKSVTTSQIPLTIVKLAAILLAVAIGERWEEMILSVCNTSPCMITMKVSMMMEEGGCRPKQYS